MEVAAGGELVRILHITEIYPDPKRGIGVWEAVGDNFMGNLC